MAQDAESVDGFPTVASPDASGSYSPCSNIHLKHEYSLCTTQAPLATITDINPGVNAAYSPTALPSQARQARRSAAVATSSHDQDGRTGRPKRRASSPPPQQLVSGLNSQFEGYSTDSLSQRMQDFQANHSTDFDGYSPDTVLKPAADTVSTSRPSIGCSVNSRSDGLPASDLDVETQPGEEWLAWEHYASLQENTYQQPLQPACRFDLAPSAEGSQATQFSYTAAAGRPGLPYQNIRGDDLAFPSTHGNSNYKDPTPSEVIPMTTLSPCSNTLALGGDPVCIRQENTAPHSDTDIDMDTEMGYHPNLYDASDVLGSRSSAEPVGGKNDEPYAQLIYRAFMSREDKSMTLQEIYQWFRENTDKAKSTGKGWQNSIRHNLSMNGAFTKRCSNQPPLNSDGSLSLDASTADGRKSTEWYLEPTYYQGVESTTRYRKGNIKGVVRAHHHRGDRAIDGNAKAASGRKGGYQAAHNRKRTKAEQQQEAARPRNKNMQPLGSHYYRDEDGRFYPGYPAQLAPNTSSPYQAQAPQGLDSQRGMPRGRRSHLSISYFQSELVENAHGVHGKVMPGEIEPAAEPTTPPGSGHDLQVDDLSYGNKYPHPYMMGFFTGDTNYQHQHQHPGAVAAGATLPSSIYPQQPAYTLHQVEGIFEPPSGIEPPLFLSGNNLTGEEAAALMAANPPWANTGPYCG